MTKAFVDEMISNMRKAGIVSKAAFWMVEGMGEKQMNVRFVGIKMTDEWLDVFSPQDNVLLKFVVARGYANLEVYIANSTPFFRIISKPFSENDKWELLLGDLKRRLKRDKADVVSHNEKVGNLYTKIKPFLK